MPIIKYTINTVYYKHSIPVAGLEPATSRLEVVCAIQLRHTGNDNI